MENEYSAESGENCSNSTAWKASKPMCDPADLNLLHRTKQCFVLIIYDSKESSFGKFRNTMVATSTIFQIYGNGEFFGMSKCLKCIDGCFPENHALGLISFDDCDQARKCILSRTEMREKDWLGGVEMYLIPLCCPSRSVSDYPFFQMDLYDVKNGKNFILYLNKLEAIVPKYGGRIIAGTSQSGKWRGLREPYFILLYQWVTTTQLNMFNDEVFPILRDAGAACSSRIVFELTTEKTQCPRENN